MKETLIRVITLLSLIVGSGCLCSDADARFRISKGCFELDSVPLVIKAAELHYARIPEEYWRHRIQMSKALGMNAVCAYVFWNFHEETPGEYNFSGNRDIRHFIELCAEEGMKVILRPGPYVCAEWEMGGLPWWLLKDKDIRLREKDDRFIDAVARFQEALAEELKGLTDAEGGPIIMIQVENEYGSYGIDKEYVGRIRDILKLHYPEMVMFQCDWSSNFTQNGLDDLLWTLNFGTWAEPEKEFAELKKLRPESPLMCSEYWSGWFDKWGSNHETRSAEDMIGGIRKMLEKDISFSLYMTHGGTSFGHWAGANSPGYAPDVTSYDYDAPIDESGNATPKYHALRALMQEFSDEELPEIPDGIKSGETDDIPFTEFAPIYSNLPSPVESFEIMSMEELNQGYGSVLYETILAGSNTPSELKVTSAHDYALVYIDGEYVGKLDRRFDERTLMLPPHQAGATLSIFVEGTGRINFGRAIKDFKGITERVTLDNEELRGWKMYCLPDDYEFFSTMEFVPFGDNDNLKWKVSSERMSPGVYRSKFHLREPSDTWLDFSGWGKGVAFLNGQPLGRFWEVGPQQTLYAPGCWMKSGENELLVFDIKGPSAAVSKGLKKPINDKAKDESPNDYGKSCPGVNSEDREVIFEGVLTEGEWLTEEVTETVTRYLMLVTDSSDASVAEIYAVDDEGNDLIRDDWKIFYVSSEEKSGNHTADKLLDLQETTYWKPEKLIEGKGVAVIDFGTPMKFSGIRILGGRGASNDKLEVSIPEGI